MAKKHKRKSEEDIAEPTAADLKAAEEDEELETELEDEDDNFEADDEEERGDPFE